MALMKSTQHAIQKEKWLTLIQERTESGLSIKSWCVKNQVSEASYYYWLKTIREDSLVRAGTLAITGCTEFAEIKAKPRMNMEHKGTVLLCTFLVEKY